MMTEPSHIEQLAAANMKPAGPDPNQEWDAAVAERMARDACDRSTAVDRLLATRAGSDLWQRACGWDARQPKFVEENGVRVATGNFLNERAATGRRIPRRP